RNENDGALFPSQAKNQELRPLVLKQLDCRNAWQGKSPPSFSFLTGNRWGRRYSKNLITE
ncbi:MAG: hypothetical protein R6U68_06800, partial [Desulfobacteraceae bacterium]